MCSKNRSNFHLIIKLSFTVDSLLIVSPIVILCKCSMFCYALLCVHSIFAIILMGKRELVASLYLWFFLSYSLTIFTSINLEFLLRWVGMSRRREPPSIDKTARLFPGVTISIPG